MVTVISGGSHSGRDKVFIDKIKSAVKNGEQIKSKSHMRRVVFS